MITICIQGESAAQILNDLQGLFASATVRPAAPTTAGEPEIVPPKARATTTRKPKAKDVTDINENGDPIDEVAETAAEAEVAPETPAPVTRDDVKAALMSLTKTKGEDAAWSLLKKYNAKNVSGVVESGKAAEFVADAKAQLAA